MKVEIKKDYYKIKILFDDLPHLCIDRKKYVGYQSWTDGYYYSIEYYYDGGKILTEQDTKDKWIEILKALNDRL